ncbi:MAG TPA: hypothetical protein VN327_10545 [Pseudonocardiaceae bacterium]|jgi:hypothetical protein|nr:hypothetical protein [Pseudonocardiaceae bacterium]
MNAPVMDLDLRERHEQAEQRRAEAAEAEQAAYLYWQEAYGAYDLARDEASAALRAWAQALLP